MINVQKRVQSAYETLQKTYALSLRQVEQFKLYATMLQDWNERFNITAHTTMEDIVQYHFFDSLAVSSFIDLSKPCTVVDVGTGGGFPAVPLKIMHPHISLILVEVNAKKREFLEHVAQKLELSDIIVSELDWRTFLRKTSYHADYVIARASLQPSELIRVFKPSSAYKDTELIYWASELWQPKKAEKDLIVRDVSYSVGTKTRRFIFFKDV